MISTKKPKFFSSRFTIVSCFVECAGKILLLHRQDHKPEGDTWGVPAGKIQPGEDNETAIQRELYEETGIQLEFPPTHIQELYVSFPTYEFIYHIFHTELHHEPTIIINPDEHKNFHWVTPQDALNGTIPLINELDACIKFYYHI